MSEQESYGADPWLISFWMALTGIPVPLLIPLAFRDGLTSAAAEFLLVSLICPFAVLVFALRFRVTFGRDTFEYRRWASTIRIPYRDIASIEITNTTPVTGDAIGAFIVTRDGRRLPFWPKLFPRPAVTRFFALAD